jgi:hypothetical protein
MQNNAAVISADSPCCARVWAAECVESVSETARYFFVARHVKPRPERRFLIPSKKRPPSFCETVKLGFQRQSAEMPATIEVAGISAVCLSLLLP